MQKAANQPIDVVSHLAAKGCPVQWRIVAGYTSAKIARITTVFVLLSCYYQKSAML